MRLKSLHCFSVIFLASVWLTGCGGSSSEGGGPAGGVPPTPFSVASQDNGGVATATYDSENAGIINDAVFDLVEGVNSGLFWSGNTNGDSITIALDDDYLVSQITMYTNATNTTDTTIQYSTDGLAYTSITLFSDCPTMVLGSGRIACTFASARQMSHLRVLVNSNAASVRIYELVAMGVLATP
ncbi:MAG: hypothetical protein ACK4SX_11880 [Alcanivoracaceae bacterium]